MAAAEGSAVKRFDADFKKIPGTLSITNSAIAWVPKTSGAMDRQSQALNRAMAMFASKATSAKVSLKVTFKDDIPAGGLLFTFSSPDATADRTSVQDTLIPYITTNRSGPTLAPGTGTGTGTGTNGTNGGEASGAGSPATPALAPGTPDLLNKGKRKANAYDPSTPTSTSNSDAGTGGKRPMMQNGRIKQRVLKKNPNLKVLYTELVLGKEITEEEFWDGREAILQAEELAYSQKPGRASRLLDDRFDLDSKRKGQMAAGGTGVGVKSKADSGPVVLEISKELTREIFEEFPVVQDAYARYVPGISEGDFWSRYFQSQLWERQRASVRKTANDDVAKKKDDIFDQYLEDPDWDIAPRAALPEHIEKFLDLSASEEDHGETATVRDYTMQAGRERSSLPLIRRFNDHSKKLLQAGGNKKTTLSTSTVPDDDIYNEIELEDLRGPAVDSTIRLDVQDQEDQTNEEDNTARGIVAGKSPEELLAISRDQLSATTELKVEFNSVCVPNPITLRPEEMVDQPPTAEEGPALDFFHHQRDASMLAMNVVKDLHLASNAENADHDPLPEAILQQMKSCHNAANEFLRQYWSAILPTQAGALGNPNPAAKGAKAGRMAGYLRGMEGKMNAVVHTAVTEGLDPMRIRAAMAATLGAVKVALQREDRRLKALNGSS